MKTTEPLSQFPLLATHSVDEAEQVLSRALTGCTIKKLRHPERFALRINGTDLGKTSLVYNRYNSETHVESELPGEPVFFNIGVQASTSFQLGGLTQISHPGKPVLLANATKMKIHRPEGSSLIVLRAWMSDLEHHLETLIGRSLRGRLVFEPRLDDRCQAGAGLARLIRFLVGELENNPQIAAHPVFRRSYESLLLDALLMLPHNRQELLLEDRPHEHSPHLVRRSEDYMRANLGEPVTVADLVRLCHCSRSSLFAAFQNARGYSPMEFLTEERLQAVRRRLMHPDASTTVSSSAMECGLVHLGRFSRTYRKRFGEAPSVTLRRNR